MSTLLLIPWIVYGYKHPYARFLGLCQTRKNLLILFCIEVIYWLVLVLMVRNQDFMSAGDGSFAWRFILFYEKGIIPIWVTAEKISLDLAEKIDADYKILYLIAALIMDYIFLFFISPRPPQRFKKRKIQVSK